MKHIHLTCHHQLPSGNAKFDIFPSLLLLSRQIQRSTPPYPQHNNQTLKLDTNPRILPKEINNTHKPSWQNLFDSTIRPVRERFVRRIKPCADKLSG